MHEGLATSHNVQKIGQKKEEETRKPSQKKPTELASSSKSPAPNLKLERDQFKSVSPGLSAKTSQHSHSGPASVPDLASAEVSPLHVAAQGAHLKRVCFCIVTEAL